MARSAFAVATLTLAATALSITPAHAAGACSASDCFQELTQPATVAAGGTYTVTSPSASCKNAGDAINLAVYDGVGALAGKTSVADPNGGALTMSVKIPAGAAPSEAQVLMGCSTHPTELHTVTTITNGSKIAITRLAGAARDLTSTAASTSLFPAGGGANSVVLASDASFADALAGAPLAAQKSGPLLLTNPGGLDPAVAAEISRVLPKGKTVYILGGGASVSTSVDATIQSMGYTPQRLAGADRFGTATAVADALGDPLNVLEVNGLNFPDGLAAGAASAQLNAVVLLTNGTSQAPATAAYLKAHSGGQHIAVGGAAATADPSAVAIVGGDRYQTAAFVAQAFFQQGTAATVGFASGQAFPDALSGGANMAARGGPLVLVPPSGALPAAVSGYLGSSKGLVGGFIYGGTAAVGADVAAELATA